ncbi:MAG: hypothetical protein ACC641_10925 [Acidiferrobacterales bacterium]
MAFAIFLLVGPAPEEIGRLSDLFEAIAAHEPNNIRECDLYLANDGNSDLQQLGIEVGAFRSVNIFNNPGYGISPYVWDRQTNGTFEALRRISKAESSEPYRFLLKLDTDALVIAPFYERITAFFNAYPRAGSIGTHLHFPSGELRPGNFTMMKRIPQCMMANPVPELVANANNKSYQRRVNDTLPDRRSVISSAQKNGFFASQHVQGGGYALSQSLLQKLRQRNWPSCIDMFNGTGLGEDIATAILTKAAGFELMDCNHPGELFGVWFQELRLTLQDIVERNYAVIHSIKTFDTQSEDNIRRFFKARRESLRGR